MQISLSSPTKLRISWPQYSPQVEAELQRRLATVPGLERGRGRVAYAPIIQLARLMHLFPKASLDYAAMQSADEAARTCYRQLVGSGIALRLSDQGSVTVAGDTSSEIAQYVADRSHALAPFVREQMEQGELVRVASVAIDVQYPKQRKAKRATP